MVSVVDAAAYGVLVAAALVGAALYRRLPSPMAVHFGASGRPDGFAPRPVGVLAVPALGVGILALSDLTSSGDALSPAFFLALAAFLAYVQGVVLAWNLGSRVNVAYAVLPALGAFLVAVFLLLG